MQTKNLHKTSSNFLNNQNFNLKQLKEIYKNWNFKNNQNYILGNILKKKSINYFSKVLIWNKNNYWFEYIDVIISWNLLFKMLLILFSLITLIILSIVISSNTIIWVIILFLIFCTIILYYIFKYLIRKKIKIIKFKDKIYFLKKKYINK